MSYGDFTFDLLEERFDVRVREARSELTSVPPVAISDFLRMALDRFLPLVGGVATEKARSEWLIAPMLSELREAFQRELSIFSGADFSVDHVTGLIGYCDFLVSLAPNQILIEAPVVTVVEAKRENLTAGLPQCIAEMVAARQFNARRNESLTPCGVVTSGTEWRFLRLEGDVALVDTNDLSIREPERVLGALIHSVNSAARSSNTEANNHGK